MDKLTIHYNEKGYNYKSSTRYSIPVWSHLITMGKRRIVKTWESADVEGIFLNRFPELDNGRHGTYHEISCAPENEGILLNTSAPLFLMRLSTSAL